MLIQEYQENLRVGIQVSGVALARYNYVSNMVTLSPEAALMFGFGLDELEVSRDRLHGIVHPDQQAELEELSAQARDPMGQGWFACDIQVVLPDGETRWLSVHKQVFFTGTASQESKYPEEQRHPSYGILAAIDITERKETAAALLKTEEQFHILADNISQLAWIADAQGDIFWCNRRWVDYTGITVDQMSNYGWKKAHHPESADRVVERFRACIESGEPWEETFRLRGKDGSYRWFLSRAIPIADAENKILRWFGTNTDVTDLKMAQLALEERNTELDSFVHIVSHDLKAPLRAISNLSQWIEDDLEGTLSASVQEQMTLLRTRVHRMQALIDELLDYALVGRVDSTVELVDLQKLLREVVDSVAPPPTFTITIAPDLPRLHTKRLFLSQVFANLIGNAVKYHDRLDGSVHISAQECGEFYEFAVADDGPGIDPVYQDNIFVIFQTAAPKNVQGSTGIGLAIVKKIIETESGAIRLESELGKGTTLYFTWPKNLRG
jgi:PAS domain S-box-containing protein